MKKQHKFHQYWLLRLETFVGEHVHYTYIPIQAASKKELDQLVYTTAEEQYEDGVYNKEDQSFEFDGGRIAICIDDVRKVDTKEEFEMLEKYL